MERKTGYSIYDRLTNYTVIDLETTGCNPAQDEIIELGALKVRDGQVVAEYDQLVKPFFPLDDYTTELTGITDEMLKDAPPIEDVILSFVDFIGGDAVVGHNVIFDVNFTYDALIRHCRQEFHNDYADTLRLSSKVLPKLPHHRLCDMVAYFGIDCGPAHRSLADCFGAYGLYECLWSKIESEGIVISKPRRRRQKSQTAAAPLNKPSHSSEDALLDVPCYKK